MPLSKLFSGVRKAVRRKSADQRHPQTTPTSSSTSGPLPPTPAVAQLEPREPSPTAAVAQSDSCITQPPHDPTSASGLPGRLWTQAYEAVNEDNPKLVHGYETLMSRVLGGESDPSCRKQMDQIVREGLEKTKNEAVAKQKIGDGMHVISSVRDLVGAALRQAPEAAAAWGGVCLLLQLLENPIQEASANRDGMAYVVSRMAWYWNLSALLDRDQSSVAGLRDELEKHIIDLYEKLLSYQMKSVCSYYRSRVAVALRDVVKFDNWTNTIQSLKDAENIVQRDIDTHSTQEIRISLDKVAEEAEHRRTQLQHIHEAIQENTKKHEEWRQDDKTQKCLSDLRLVDPRLEKQRIEDTKGGLFPGASNWILDHHDFQQWRNRDDVSILWIKGDPGKGKTMLLITIVNELEQSPASGNTVLSYFFCQGTNKVLNNATAVLRGLIYLLGVRHPPLVSHIREDYDHAGSKLFNDEDSFFALSKVLESMFRDESLTRMYLVVDALDECMAHRDRLLKLIAYHATYSPRVKWVVSSRNKDEIERHLSINSGTKLGLEVTENAKQVSRAVNAYIDYKISELPSLQDDRELRDRVRGTIFKKANGTFLWVAIVAQELEKAKGWRIEQVVEKMPAGLQQLYNLMMSQILESKEDWEVCQPVLATVTLAYRPLSLPELGVISALAPEISGNTKYIREVIALCGSFLTVKDDFVYAIHQSVKDYLSGEASSAIFPSGTHQIHHGIFSRSIQALSSGPLRRNIYDLPHPGRLIDDVVRPNPDPLAAVQYSCIHWINHLCEGIANSSGAKYQHELNDEGRVSHFLPRHFLHWLEASSLLRAMSDAVLSVTKLESLLRTLEGHGHSVTSVAFSSDSRLVASGSEDHTIKIWDATTGGEVHTLEGHSSKVTSVTFTSDSKLVASGSHDHSIKIWDAATGREVHTLKGHRYWVTSVAFSSDSKLMASGSVDNTVKIWDAATGREIHSLEGHSNLVTSVAFSSNSKLVASGSEDHTIKIWDAATGHEIHTLRGHSGQVTSVVFSNDLELMASGSDDHTIKIWDAATGREVHTLEGHSYWVISVAFSSDSKLVASGSHDNTIKVWDAATGREVRTLEGHSDIVTSVTFSSDSKLIASGSDDHTIKIWDAAMGREVHTLKGHRHGIISVAYSRDSKLVALGSVDHTVKIWDAATGREIHTLEGHSDLVKFVAFSSDSKLVASGSYDYTIKIWDVATGREVHTLKGRQFTLVAFSNDSKLMASGSDDNTIKIWDVATGHEIHTLKGHSHSITSVAFSSDSKLVASGSVDNTIKIWDAAIGCEVHTLEGHSRLVKSVAFSSDSKLVASGSDDYTIKIWDAVVGHEVQTLDVGKAVYELSFDTYAPYLLTNIGPIRFNNALASYASIEAQMDLVERVTIDLAAT